MKRVMIGGLPPMLRDITARVVAQQADMELVEAPVDLDLTSMTAEQAALLNADALILSQDAGTDALLRLVSATGAVVVAIAGDGRTARRYFKRGERIEHETLDGLDLKQLVGAIGGDDRAH